MLIPGTPFERERLALVLRGEPHVGDLAEPHEVAV